MSGLVGHVGGIEGSAGAGGAASGGGASSGRHQSLEGVTSVSLKYQARAVAAVTAETSKHLFVTGTASLREVNQLELFEYVDDTSETLVSRKVFPHPDEVWSLAPCPYDAGLIWTGHNGKTAGEIGRATLWRMEGVEAADASDSSDEDDTGGDSAAGKEGSGAAGSGAAPARTDTRGELTSLVSLPGHGSSVHTVLWSPRSKPSSSQILTMDSSSAKLWTLSDGGRKAEPVSSVESDPAHFISTGAWDPHHPNEFVVGRETSVVGYDLRTMEVTRTVDNAHTQVVRCTDYNPNKPWYMATSGDDTLVKFWDLRKASAPVKVLDGHTHWVWSVRYNPFHDSLVLSGGSDAEALLWRVSSISSAPLLEADEEDGETGTKSAVDAVVSHVEGHEDSVYSVAWSAFNAWAFASLSFTGRLTVASVPSVEKYKILL